MVGSLATQSTIRALNDLSSITSSILEYPGVIIQMTDLLSNTQYSEETNPSRSFEYPSNHAIHSQLTYISWAM